MAEYLLLLALGDPVGVGPGAQVQSGASRRRVGRDHCLLHARGCQCGAVPARALETESGIIRAMRFVRVVLALVFGLAMAGRETHVCPVHSAAPAHHQGSHQQQSKAHCTCPQACCPATPPTALRPAAPLWRPAPARLRALDPDLLESFLLPSRKRVLPPALAPPPPVVS